jgi:plasmid stabilization system protein ParE
LDFQVRITEAALKELEEVLAFSWEQYPDTAERFGIALLNHVDLLGRFPMIGAPVVGRRGLRVLVHTPLLVYYWIDYERGAVEVLHFWHGSRRSPRI